MSSDKRTPIWLDCDTGHDDAFAILVAVLHPHAEILGVSTIYGNAPLEQTTYNTRAILKAIGRDDVPTYAGAAKPFCRDAFHAPDIHGDSGLDGTTCLPIPDAPLKTDVAAVEAMYRALSSTPKGTAWLVPTGALTNAALLFATHPDLIDHIAGISLMGGAIGGGFTNAPMGTVEGEGERFGNVTPWAEFNIYIDPESARSILCHPVLAAKTTLIPLDLTHQFLATQEIQKSLLYGQGPRTSGTEPSVVRRLFFEILTFFAKTYAEVFNITAGPPVHDPLAVVAAFAPQLFDDGNGERFEVDVVTEGLHGSSSGTQVRASQVGRTVAAPVLSGSPGIRIPRGLASDEIWRLIESCLGLAEAAGS